jgi:quinol monooxygenase YgiN
MWGMIAKITTVAGKRDEMAAVLKEGGAAMPGCLSYVVAFDVLGENTLWVTEAWDSQASHDASLSLPQVQRAVTQSKSLVAGFERVAVTEPVWGVGA